MHSPTWLAAVMAVPLTYATRSGAGIVSNARGICNSATWRTTVQPAVLSLRLVVLYAWRTVAHNPGDWRNWYIHAMKHSLSAYHLHHEHIYLRNSRWFQSHMTWHIYQHRSPTPLLFHVYGDAYENFILHNAGLCAAGSVNFCCRRLVERLARCSLASRGGWAVCG
jgi:hypothetical protein